MRILVIDDDVEYAGFVAGSLRHAGHDVDTMHSGFGVANRVAGRGAPAPDLVVLDYFMPGLGGDAVLQMLTRSAETTRVPVILHSSLDATMVDAAIRNHPLAVFVQKTGRVRRLLDTIAFVSRSVPRPVLEPMAS